MFKLGCKEYEIQRVKMDLAVGFWYFANFLILHLATRIKYVS